MLRRSVALILVLLATAGLAGCGSSSSTVSPAAYMKSVCTAVVQFRNELKSRTSAVESIERSASPKTRKTTLVTFLASAASVSGTAVRELKAAGAPGVKNGTQVQSTIIGTFVHLQSAISSAANRAKALPTTSLSAFQRSGSPLVSTFEASVQDLGTSVSSLKSPALDQAARKVSACKAISSS
jgi:hypothetical protein